MSEQTLKENSVYKLLVPRPSQPEQDSLKESIRLYGQRMPIIVNQDGVIIDGYTRYAMCQLLGIVPKTMVMEFESVEEEKLAVLEMNLHRRHLNDFQKIELAQKMLEIEREYAAQRQFAGKTMELIPSHSDYAKGKAIGHMAEKLGISQSKCERGQAVLERGSDELKDKTRRGDFSVNTAYYKLPGVPKPTVESQERLEQMDCRACHGSGKCSRCEGKGFEMRAFKIG